MDCDFSHDPNDLERLYNACAKDGNDLSIGSRYCRGGKVKNWPFMRWLMSYFASVYVRMVLWLGVKDTTAGFVCHRRKLLEAIDLSSIQFVGYAFQIEMKYTSKRLGFSLVEVPITFIDRHLGQSKMSMKIFKEAFWGCCSHIVINHPTTSFSLISMKCYPLTTKRVVGMHRLATRLNKS